MIGVNFPLKIARVVHILQGQVFFPSNVVPAVFTLQRLEKIFENFVRILKFRLLQKKCCPPAALLNSPYNMHCDARNSSAFCTFPAPERYIEKVQNAASALASQCIVRIFF